MQNFGRFKIITDYKLTGNEENDKVVIPLIIEETLALHLEDVANMNNAFEYYYNTPEILQKEKTNRQDINYKIRVPNAHTVVETINAYSFSIAPKCISRQIEKEEYIKEFNDCLDFDNNGNKLRKIAFYNGICGLGYRLVLVPTKEDIDNGRYIKTVTDIDPRNAYCVYNNDIGRDKVLGIIYYNHIKHDIKNGVVTDTTVTTFNVFTKWAQWIFEKENGLYSIQPFNIPLNSTMIEMLSKPYAISDLDGGIVAFENKIPLIEYPRNPARINDFELCTTIIDAINTIISYATDAIAQNVDYVFKLKNIDIGEKDENGDNPQLDIIKSYLRENIIAIKGVEGATIQPDIDILEVPLNQSEVRSLIDYLEAEFQVGCFIPSRAQGTGQDTGAAVENRNGFRSLEDVACITTNTMLESEKEFMEVAISFANEITTDNPFGSLTLKDIKIDPMRNKVIDISTTMNAVVAGLKANIPPEIVYETTNFVPDYIDSAKRTDDYRKEREQELSNIQVNQAIEISKGTAQKNSEEIEKVDIDK